MEPQSPQPALYVPQFPLRVVTAASLFDGHDASINIMRRILQRQGAEVIHLGHNRSVDEVVNAAVSEDVHAVALSSYQGGHVEYFTYLVDRLREAGRGDIKIFGGGGGVIIQSEIDQLEAYGVTKIFSPADGQTLGLDRMINTIFQLSDRNLALETPASLERLVLGEVTTLARVLTALEANALDEHLTNEIFAHARVRSTPVLGITGTGGSGKSSLTDELLLRLKTDQGNKVRTAVLAIDPSKRMSGGALLGDRIRMNAIESPQIFFRSLATRNTKSEIPPSLPAMIAACKAAQFDLIIVETPGIGQGDAAIVDVADVSLYVMTPEFGADSQLEKIDMMDFADVIAINKFDRRGSLDARRSVVRQWNRIHRSPSTPNNTAPVFGTVASRFNDQGTTALYHHLVSLLKSHGLNVSSGVLPTVTDQVSPPSSPILPLERAGYLKEIARTVRSYHSSTKKLAEKLSTLQHLQCSIKELEERSLPVPSELKEFCEEYSRQLPAETSTLVSEFETLRAHRRERTPTDPTAEFDASLFRRSLSGTFVPKVALPSYTDHGELLAWLREENLPGSFPYTAGVFPFKRTGEDPARMFAGEGDPQRTNRRFHLLAEGQPATRLSTAFDSVTLYGRDPSTAPDVYGKVGTSGVSVATLEDMKELFKGFDLCDPKTSVSMTINGPAPTILAMFFNTAIDQQIEAFEQTQGRPPTEGEREEITAQTLSTVRGTVQADILKEDQGQNTCLFSTEFSLKAMADIEEYFVQHHVRNFYSVSISGYHIAEAGANPLTQLAFTLANGFTYVEAYLNRGLPIDEFAANLSFFFSNGMDPEYSVIGRVARRLWAIALKEYYGANERSQKLKYHIQTSGRSLHAQEMTFNDIRTTLQALCALYDNANSLHTNAFDEAVTTPSEQSVRQALAIQLIIAKEWGLSYNENPLQGSFIISQLTDLVEEAVLAEFERLSDRGGVLGAMETGYQRGKIQDDSLLYEEEKHSGALPIVGVNTFVRPESDQLPTGLKLSRSSTSERDQQIEKVNDFKLRHRDHSTSALEELHRAVLTNQNVFDCLMRTVRHATLGEITQTLFDAGGIYRRNV
ncbi:MAG: fused isobutyryl-CoA mutase/GTPase IcmF [Acidimicrobiales bacterium]